MNRLLKTFGHCSAYADNASSALALILSIVAGLLLVDGMLESSFPSIAIGVIAFVAAKTFSQTPLPSDD
ncbi:hypothetical protein QN382_19385 [Pseudomonas sp. 10B1]|uniref:hypothetical protein n=1 Tax=unclassified Pseudomonas TaxID=196821 RepID=UPI002AB40FC2|nr:MULTISPECIES: hypothetical protein [unclassified Pseudomonas]MDY7560028.1 hypothetical protein [Pseudomonas sp. AB6]MEA9979357.1 hypothetical protein [Pseudomonas sp. RTS4]MEA9997092.1 hypothetical protein [Pseudomonas sp. AA4]MEB0089286.1 hypothetical protein [Pseudomonas sp. RTI1]MEB0128451.1 hypothetical protein [Pseudomonas sp. CCC1.2]